MQLRPIVAFAIAPLSPGAIFGAIALLGAVFGRGLTRGHLHLFIGLLAVSSTIAYPIAITVILPVYLHLKGYWFRSLPFYMLLALILGSWPYIEIVLTSGRILTVPLAIGMEDPAWQIFLRPVQPYFGQPPVSLSWIPIGAGLTATAMLCFWLIARPDRRLPTDASLDLLRE